MGIVFAIVAPVFGIIALGYLSGRFGLLGDNASRGISDFAFKLAIPALLFRTVANADFSGSGPIVVWVTFFGAAAITWLLASLLVRSILARPADDAPSISMVATFGNTAMLGLPLSLSTFGPEAAVPAALILSLHAPLLWLAGTVQVATTGSESDKSFADIGRQMLRELGGNPIILGIFGGMIWAASGFAIPSVLSRMLDLLAAASVPSALIALGLSLVKFQIKGQTWTLASVIALKLIAMPLMAYLIGSQFFSLAPMTLGVIVIMAAMPTGANAFLFALRYERAVNSASGAIALGTVLGALTISVVIAIVRTG